MFNFKRLFVASGNALDSIFEPQQTPALSPRSSLHGQRQCIPSPSTGLVLLRMGGSSSGATMGDAEVEGQFWLDEGNSNAFRRREKV